MRIFTERVETKSWDDREESFHLYKLGRYWILREDIRHEGESYAYFTNEDEARSLFDRINSQEDWWKLIETPEIQLRKPSERF